MKHSLIIDTEVKHVAIGTTPKGEWSASVSDDWTVRVYGNADNPQEALNNAIDKYNSCEPIIPLDITMDY